MWKYFTAKNALCYLDVIPELESSCNSTYHRSIKMAPNQVSSLNVGSVRRNLYGNIKSKVKFKFHVRDWTHISKSRRTSKSDICLIGLNRSSLFPRGLPKDRPIYKLMDDSGEEETPSCWQNGKGTLKIQ